MIPPAANPGKDDIIIPGFLIPHSPLAVPEPRRGRGHQHVDQAQEGQNLVQDLDYVIRVIAGTTSKSPHIIVHQITETGKRKRPSESSDSEGNECVLIQ